MCLVQNQDQGWRTSPPYLGKFLSQAETDIARLREVLPRNSTCLILHPLSCWRGRVWLADSFNMQTLDSLSMNKQETPRIEPSVRKTKGGELWILPASCSKVLAKSQDLKVFW